MAYTDLNTPSRTIMTPGPVEADPRVLRAMSTPVIGQFDPQFLNIMNETMDLLRYVFQTKNKWAYPIDGTSRSGLEAVLCSTIEPGDKVLVPIFGRFGYLLAEIASRCNADVYTMEAEWGDVFDAEQLKAEIKKVNPKIVAVVHGETSTGRMQPLEELGKFCRENDVLLVVDAVATLGGVDFKTDDWHIDAVITGTQKNLAVPSGMAPITYNDRIEKILLERKKIERGLSETSVNSRRIQSNYFDLSQIQDYWTPDRLNHHTEATSMLYALREGLRVIQEETLEERFERHLVHGEALNKGLKAMGVELFGGEENRMPVVTVVKVPDGLDEAKLRATMLNQFGIEIAGAFGPLKGQVVRIGSMGYSCRKNNILRTLGALEATLTYHGAKVNQGDGVQAALEFYTNAKEPVTI
ncbi:(S)-ureidoglycine-glyoxylate aminotransferase [Scopulibacillus darangshiensis]|uniref:(S)-ureidoglycine-glyoxylate aminotransferase n=1 Tax=Scopulibacillus darangshiensis TaxID=442528 RepID=A0A4R2NJB8_9BACL|nr:alanine--glyoxylate aminotransferase family protein [Scopulibacillus darangshiensis]TCP21649.1 (S)-ureidoglycine-glyoxylate aminotransferase [Scopulibacillus darangshiensis]